jgi:hypothetical protein
MDIVGSEAGDDRLLEVVKDAVDRGDASLLDEELLFWSPALFRCRMTCLPDTNLMPRS